MIVENGSYNFVVPNDDADPNSDGSVGVSYEITSCTNGLISKDSMTTKAVHDANRVLTWCLYNNLSEPSGPRLAESKCSRSTSLFERPSKCTHFSWLSTSDSARRNEDVATVDRNEIRALGEIAKFQLARGSSCSLMRMASMPTRQARLKIQDANSSHHLNIWVKWLALS